jgi:hypothetical protein
MRGRPGRLRGASRTVVLTLALAGAVAVGGLSSVADAGTSLAPGSARHPVSLAPPVASFTVTPAPAGDPTSFNASASKPAIISYTWDFGDGSAPDELPTPLVTHVYASPGTYVVVLTVRDDAQESAYAQQSVVIPGPGGVSVSSVAPGSPAVFSYKQVCGGVVVTFSQHAGQTHTTTPVKPVTPCTVTQTGGPPGIVTVAVTGSEGTPSTTAHPPSGSGVVPQTGSLDVTFTAPPGTLVLTIRPRPASARLPRVHLASPAAALPVVFPTHLATGSGTGSGPTADGPGGAAPGAGGAGTPASAPAPGGLSGTSKSLVGGAGGLGLLAILYLVWRRLRAAQRRV